VTPCMKAAQDSAVLTFRSQQASSHDPPAVRKVVACAFDHAGAQGDDQCGVTARLSKLTSGSG
jgi:hypothetical protein